MKHLTAPRMNKCIGCQLCSLACARINYQRVSWTSAGIRIQATQSNRGLLYSAHYCLACDPAPCTKACASQALSPQRSGGVFFQQELCNQCGNCQQSCPVGAIHQDSTGQIFLCTQCGQCVSFCPQKCIEMQEVTQQ